MASITRSIDTEQICNLCSTVSWWYLPPEECSGAPHHKSRKAIEDSAKTCILCRMILRAAISNFQTRNRDDHHWREYTMIGYQDETGGREMVCIRELGVRPPDARIHSGHHLRCINPVPTDFVKSLRVPVFAPTRYETPEDYAALPNIGELEIASPTEDLPVWLYGNWWAEYGTDGNVSEPSFCLVGIGARFGSSSKPADAFNSNPGEISVCGSAISICITDGG